MELVKYDAAKAAIAECERVDEAKDWVDKMAACEAYYRQAGDRDLMRKAFRIRMRAKRRFGELSKAMPKAAPGPKPEISSDSEPISAPKPKGEALAEMGAGKTFVYEAERLAALAEKDFDLAVNGYEPPSENALLALDPQGIASTPPFVSHNTGKVEWYTPPAIVESARKVLGGITLDPASTAKANEVVKADRFITAEEDALTPDKVWGDGRGERAFINPPYASELVGRFADALGEQLAFTYVDRAIWLSNNCTETKWAAQLMEQATAVCFPTGRMRFLDENLEPVGAPLQGQMILAVGGVDPVAFMREFAQYGPVAFFPDQFGEPQDVKHDIFENEIPGR